METIRIGDFQNFNQIIDLYLESLKMLSVSNSDKFKQKKLDKLANKDYIFSYVTMSLINDATKIEQIYETTDFSKDKWDAVFSNKDLYVPFLDINVKDVADNDRSLDAFKKKFDQIRNCIAHSNFHLEIEDKKDDDVGNNIIIVFDDPCGIVEGKIPFYTYSRLPNVLNGIFNREKMVHKNHINFNVNGITANDPNRFLTESLRKMTIKDKTSGKRTLTNEEKKRVKDFSLLIGSSEMKNNLLKYANKSSRSSNIKETALTNDFSGLIWKIINPEESVLNTQDIDGYNMFLRTLYKYQGVNLEAPLSTMITQPSEIDDEKDRQTYEFYYNNIYSKISLREVRERQLEKFFMYRPFLYNEGLLCMINYIVGYIREQNINYGRSLFKFENIDVSGVTIDIDNPEEPAVTVTNPGEKKLKEIEQLEMQMAARQRSIHSLLERNTSNKGHLVSLSRIATSKGIDPSDGFITKISELKSFLTNIESKAIGDIDIEEVEKHLHEYIEFLDNSDKMRLPYPRAILDNIKNGLKQLEPLYSEAVSLDQRIAKAKLEYDRVKNEPSYTDTSSFFAHLRNSIVHSNVKVDYSKAAKGRKIEDIEYTFTDHKKGQPNWITFKATISGKDLIRIMQDVQESINRQVNGSDKNKLFENKYLKVGVVDENIDSNEIRDNEGKEKKEEDKAHEN